MEKINHKWISVVISPEDDQSLFVINDKIKMLPIKAYYDKEWDEFISLESGPGTLHPISATHWMPLFPPP